MKCEVDRGIFTECLQGAVGALPARTTYDVLQNVLLEVKGNHLFVHATDLDTYVRKELPLAPESRPESGRVVVAGRKLLDIARELSEPLLTLTTTERNVVLQSGQSHYTFTALDPAEYPEAPQMPPDKVGEFPAPVVKEAFDAVAFSVARDQSRPSMCGVNWEIDDKEMKMVATDGHRLAWVRKPGTFKTTARLIVDPKIVPLGAWGDEKVAVRTGGGKIGLEFAGTIVISRLIEGPYPDYERVIPKTHQNRLKASQKNLAASLRRAAVFANPLGKPVTLVLKGGGDEILAETDVGSAQEILAATYEGEDVTIAFNAGFLLEFLRHIPTDEVVLELGAAGGAGVIKPVADEPDRLYLLMPIRMD